MFEHRPYRRLYIWFMSSTAIPVFIVHRERIENKEIDWILWYVPLYMLLIQYICIYLDKIYIVIILYIFIIFFFAIFSVFISIQFTIYYSNNVTVGSRMGYGEVVEIE